MVDILLSIPKALNQVQRRSLKCVQPKMQISIHVTTKLQTSVVVKGKVDEKENLRLENVCILSAFVGCSLI